MVFETMGNQSASTRPPFLRLMIAIEDFSIPEGRTDLSVGPDDVPSGLCRQMRLNRNDATYHEASLDSTERVWDALGGLNGNALRRCGEIFYIVFNLDSKRWEILQSANIRLIPAVVNNCIGDGWHEVEITDWDERWIGEGSSSVSASVSDENDCNTCSVTGVDTDTVCESGSQLEIIRDVGNRTGEIVYAHTTHLLPMMVGGLIKMIKRTVAQTSCSSDSASASASDSLSASVSDLDFSDRIYDVVSPVFPIAVLPFPIFECCTDPCTGVQTVEMVQCNKAMVEGYWCEGPYLGCPNESASCSESV